MTINDALAINPTIAIRDRELLLAHVLGVPRERIFAHPEAPVHPARMMRYRRLLRQRARGVPISHLIGEQWFFGRPFRVTRDVLIPRPETELLIDLMLDRVRSTEYHTQKPTIVDVGTGSGCIAVTLASELPSTRVIAIDDSPAALRIARANARRLGCTGRITFLRGNLLSPLLLREDAAARAIRAGDAERGSPTARRSPSSTVGVRSGRTRTYLRSPALLLANLPYLTTAEWRALPKSIRAFEPRMALDGGTDGLVPFRALFEQLLTLSAISDQRSAFLEIDPRRTHALELLARKALPGWERSWHRDLAGRWRVLELTTAARN